MSLAVFEAMAVSVFFGFDAIILLAERHGMLQTGKPEEVNKF